MPKSAGCGPVQSSVNMLVQEMVLDNDSNQSQDIYERHFAPMKSSKSDVPFPPLATPRKCAPSVTCVTDRPEQDGQSMGVLTVKATSLPLLQSDNDRMDASMQSDGDGDVVQRPPEQAKASLHDLPLEVQGKVLDFIFGDMHSVYAASTSLRGKSVSSLMRHPRRKAVADLALVSPAWRDLVQERIYRHIKIKGTRAGLAESADFFLNHMHLTRLVRHIEFWVPVWGDKASLEGQRSSGPMMGGGGAMPERNGGYHHFASQTNESLIPANDFLGYGFKLSAYSATLSEIFSHISCFFPNSRVFTLEGGHCKQSNMIRHFPQTLFPDPNQQLEKLPNIRTFAMRGAWNIMRNYSHWKTIELALPNVEEWHCGYAKPRFEADATINTILQNLPLQLRHINISLDGMYSKDPMTVGSSYLPGQPHLCERLGKALPHLESLTFTGKICECLWTSALAALSGVKEEPRLKSLEIVVKSCCRQRVTDVDPQTGETIVHELGGVMADGAGITNLVFIRAFERLVMHTVEALPRFPHLNYVRIRFIDLDSPCTLLNPYWQLEGKKVYGIWNEEIVERLSEVRPDVGYVELGDGIEYAGYHRKSSSGTPNVTGVGDSNNNNNTTTGVGASSPTSSSSAMLGIGSTCSLYPKLKPRSIKTSSYKVVADAR
ncbi:hypothetical protein HRR83_003396 [Exophiala dermatitidis]|uniref:Uncharacterized protein n=2 Tax=Exophiala dermatitidis TaxID=5970 RepID=H6BMG2_EXODN|nr:uncharacterized protein HMPREF1120_00263 [Exophiala dermatitidis NIH/UT8656]KAJ4514706.1 hypothetical protein HRR75_004070 [Exophiala dermatitidis]EHY52044.1 hypothetical protein HMPREF1120_00263 [Exophiala dermatitidis NIH/UT8656]KAJ4518150.1 hypothetical protein HRR74_004445 [Exophiala dermatitidis]KAJ4521048.1 hypothetical protein HRR73_003389 [Exophiala dermatitidis]KAJ4547631.1 hypothetical protein HRR76_000263 [Exophiala dermatitidis]